MTERIGRPSPHRATSQATVRPLLPEPYPEGKTVPVGDQAAGGAVA